MPQIKVSLTNVLTEPMIALAASSAGMGDRDILKDPNKYLEYVNQVLVNKKYTIHNQNEYDCLCLLSEAKRFYPEAVQHMQSRQNAVCGHRLYSILNGEARIYSNAYTPYLQLNGNENLDWVDDLNLGYIVVVHLPSKTDAGVDIAYLRNEHANRSVVYTLRPDQVNDFSIKFPDVAIADSRVRLQYVAQVIEGSDDQIAMELSGLKPSKFIRPVNKDWCANILGPMTVECGILDAFDSIAP